RQTALLRPPHLQLGLALELHERVTRSMRRLERLRHVPLSQRRLRANTVACQLLCMVAAKTSHKRKVVGISAFGVAALPPRTDGAVIDGIGSRVRRRSGVR